MRLCGKLTFWEVGRSEGLRSRDAGGRGRGWGVQVWVSGVAFVFAASRGRGRRGGFDAPPARLDLFVRASAERDAGAED